MLGRAAPPKAPPELPELDRCISTGLSEGLFSTAACVASVGDHIFHRGVYGQPHAPPPVGVRSNFEQLYDLGSLTGPLGAGLGALWLVGKGRMDLGASLAKTVAKLRDERFLPVMLDMLLDHSAGFPAGDNLWRDLLALDAKRPAAARRAGTEAMHEDLQELIAKLELAYEPGKNMRASALDFVVLGWAIESISKQPLDRMLAREIYEPLGVAKDLFFVKQGDYQQGRLLARRVFAAGAQCAARARAVRGEVSDPLAWALGGVAGHAGLFGTVDAVWQVARALLSSYRGRERFFLGGAVKRFFTRSRRVAKSTYALGWQAPTVNDSPAGKKFSQSSVGHVGSTGGALWIDLSTDVIGVLLANTQHMPGGEEKTARIAKLHARLFELVAKHGETLLPRTTSQGASAFRDPQGRPAARKPGGRP